MKTPKCQCARCKLYIRATVAENPEYDIFEEDGITKKVTKFETREYQNALIEIAKKRNIIACLPTGSGKTFIAFKLIEHFQDEILSSGKKVIFLANTIPLVDQQAKFFARNSMLRVKHLTGDMEVDYWSGDKWANVVEGFNILAMTTQIFLNILRPAFIRLSQIVLIVFDECHHAVKEHPMKHVMQKYHESKQMEPNYPLPRILGMTATIIKGNCTEWEVADRVKELESTMQAKAVTYRDFEQVLKHSTSSRIQKYRIPNASSELDCLYLIDKLESYSKDLNKLRNERKKLKAITTINGIDATLTSPANVFLSLKKPTAGDLRIAVDDVKYSCKNLGPYCGIIATNLKLAFIEFSLMDITDGVMRDWYLKVKELFNQIKTNLERHMNNVSDQLKVVRFTTPKLRQLVDIVKAQFGMNDPPPCMFDDESGVCGIVFVDRRVTAQVIAWYMKDLAYYNSEYEFIRANFVVGTSQNGFESVEHSVYSKKQRETIEGFRTKKYNLLVATAVLEEGIDVPSCNLIVRFDKILTYTSYIQSMGRARKPDALFCALIEPEKYTKEASELDTYKRINDAMVKYLVSNVEKVDEEPSPMEIDHNVKPFCPGGTADSPSITMESAMDIMDWYCNLLPCDGISTLQSLSWWTEVKVGTSLMFQGHLKLPMNSVIRGTVVGDPMLSKHLARQAVHFKAAKMLFEMGALSEMLLPARPKIPDKIDAYFKSLTASTAPEEAEEGEVTENPNQDGLNKNKFSAWYRKKVPNVFSQRLPPCDPKTYKVYRISFDLVEPNEDEGYEFRNIYKFDPNLGLALVISQDIPNVGTFPLYGGFGRFSCSLELLNNFPVQKTHFEFQAFVFSDILGLTNRFLQEHRHTPFSIVPILREQHRSGSYSWTIDNTLIENIVGFSHVSRMRRPNEPTRQQARNYSKDRYSKFEDGAVVSPWYKKGGLIYCVDSVQQDMSPLSPFHDPNFKTYKDFVESEFKTQIYDNSQPLLKTKLGGVGKESKQKQLNYLLQKYAKEDEAPVYLVPELVHKLPIKVTSMVQLKLMPSFLHRLDRLLMAREILVDISAHSGWTGMLKETSSGDVNQDVNRLTAEQEEKKGVIKAKFEKRMKLSQKSIPEKTHIENRELHYEFIHPNRITMRDIQLFHEAVSDQHAAKKLVSRIDPAFKPDNIESPIELSPFEALNLTTLEPTMTLESTGGPSLLAVMEALTLWKSNDGVSNTRLNHIGHSFLNYVVSTHIFLSHPDWSEPLLCQLRNRSLSTTYLSAIAKKRSFGEILAASDFYPTETWVPPGFRTLVGKADLGEIAAANKLPLAVYDGLSEVELRNMPHDAVEMYVLTNAAKYVRKGKMPGLEELVGPKPPAAKTKKPKPPLTGGLYSSYSHTEVNDQEISQGFCALVGAFFIKSGASGALKALDWLGFGVPDENGENQGVFTLKVEMVQKDPENSEVLRKFLPNLKKLEEKIGYKFSNRLLLVEALTHPTYLANNETECYQRLEFLGDAILDALLTNHVFAMTLKDTNGTKYSTMELSEINKCLVNNITYASLAVRYGLHKHLLSMSKALTDMIDNFVLFQEASSHEVVGHFTLISDEEILAPKHMEVPKVLGDIFEALAGAIYLDSGGSLDTAWKIFYRLMEHEIDGFSSAIPKSPMQELHAEFQGPGEVSFMKWTSQKLRDRGRELVKISVGPHGSYFGAGTSYTRAKEASAKVALKMIKEEDLFIKDRENASNIMILC